jgi:hypothetical protein
MSSCLGICFVRCKINAKRSLLRPIFYTKFDPKHNDYSRPKNTSKNGSFPTRVLAQKQGKTKANFAVWEVVSCVENTTKKCIFLLEFGHEEVSFQEYKKRTEKPPVSAHVPRGPKNCPKGETCLDVMFLVPKILRPLQWNVPCSVGEANIVTSTHPRAPTERKRMADE